MTNTKIQLIRIVKKKMKKIKNKKIKLNHQI